MPVISKFYGIVIRMWCARVFNARFHAIYQDWELVVNIWPLTIVEGEAPDWVHKKVFEWARLHQQELLSDWNNCLCGRRPRPIAPLP
jgi:hypothetical protein